MISGQHDDGIIIKVLPFDPLYKQRYLLSTAGKYIRILLIVVGSASAAEIAVREMGIRRQHGEVKRLARRGKCGQLPV